MGIKDTVTEVSPEEFEARAAAQRVRVEQDALRRLMDPNANLEEIRRIIRQCTNGVQWDPERLVDLIEALDQWMTKGGFAPKDWQKGR